MNPRSAKPVEFVRPTEVTNNGIENSHAGPCVKVAMGPLAYTFDIAFRSQ